MLYITYRRWDGIPWLKSQTLSKCGAAGTKSFGSWSTWSVSHWSSSNHFNRTCPTSWMSPCMSTSCRLSSGACVSKAASCPKTCIVVNTARYLSSCVAADVDLTRLWRSSDKSCITLTSWRIVHLNVRLGKGIKMAGWPQSMANLPRQVTAISGVLSVKMAKSWQNNC